MKLLEVMEMMQDAYNKYGDIDLYVCKFCKKEKERYFWITSVFEKQGNFIFGFNPDPFEIVKTKKKGK